MSTIISSLHKQATSFFTPSSSSLASLSLALPMLSYWGIDGEKAQGHVFIKLPILDFFEEIKSVAKDWDEKKDFCDFLRKHQVSLPLACVSLVITLHALQILQITDGRRVAALHIAGGALALVQDYRNYDQAWKSSESDFIRLPAILSFGLGFYFSIANIATGLSHFETCSRYLPQPILSAIFRQEFTFIFSFFLCAETALRGYKIARSHSDSPRREGQPMEVVRETSMPSLFSYYVEKLGSLGSAGALATLFPYLKPLTGNWIDLGLAAGELSTLGEPFCLSTPIASCLSFLDKLLTSPSNYYQNSIQLLSLFSVLLATMQWFSKRSSGPLSLWTSRFGEIRSICGLIQLAIPLEKAIRQKSLGKDRLETVSTLYAMSLFVYTLTGVAMQRSWVQLPKYSLQHVPLFLLFLNLCKIYQQYEAYRRVNGGG